MKKLSIHCSGARNATLRKRLPYLHLCLLLVGITPPDAGSAAPFRNLHITFTQPDGAKIEVVGSGDEFYAIFETIDGYSVVFDQTLKAYCFADLAPDGYLVSSGKQVHLANPATLGINKHLRMGSTARMEQVRARFQRWDAGMQIEGEWQRRKALLRDHENRSKQDGPQAAPPSFTTTNLKMGLTLLVDFADDVATISNAEIVNFCNADTYSAFGNSGSIKKYFQDNSNGLLTYSNVVTIYIRVPLLKSYYNNPSLECENQGNQLVRDAISVLKSLPNYNTAILPTFKDLTVDGNNQVVACNVFYAGERGGVWSKGLWPHSGVLYNVGPQELSIGGMKVWKYQISDIGSGPTLGTFCHENGHMLCGFPDIYDYDQDSVGGAGMFCLMNSGGHGGNPVQICAYLKRAAGWATTVDVDSTTVINGSLTATAGANFNRFYRFQKPGVSTEYFLLEARYATGRDALLPASGVAIWHIDELGSHTNQNLNPNVSHQNYEVTLIQADNLWHFECTTNNFGDANDLYSSQNMSAGYSNDFSDQSSPNAHWWDGSPSGASFYNFSSRATTMTFQIGHPVPPQITSQPQSQTVIAGSGVTFSTSATGLPLPTFQWRFNGASISGATSSSYSIAAVKPTQAGNYSVIVNNQAGTATSSTAVLTVIVPPSITSQPQNLIVKAGSTATFSFTASGSTPLNYQWLFNNSPVAGATSSSYTVVAAEPADAGDYLVRVSNLAGNVDSAVAALTVQYAPVITSQPRSQNLTLGESVTLEVAAQGVPTPTCQWQLNGGNIAGATSSTYTLASFQLRDAGGYRALLSNSIGTSTSFTAVLALAACLPSPPGLVAWWSAEGGARDVLGRNSGVLVNGATLAAGKVGQAFAFDGISSYIRIADNPSFHCTNALTVEAWIYPTSHGAYHEIISKWGVLDPSQSSYTTSLGPSGQVGIGVCPDGNPMAAVGISSTNSLPLNRWTHFAGTYDGSTLKVYVDGVCENQVAYNRGIFPGAEALAIGAAGTLAGGQVLSPFAGLIDEPSVYNRALSAVEIQSIYNASSAGKCPLPPNIVTGPRSQAVVVGDNITLSVAAGGTQPLSYQWRLDGTNLPGASEASLTFLNVQICHAGNYDLIVSNSVGSVMSEVATISVQPRTNVWFDFETAATTPVWLGTTQILQNTTNSHQGTNAVAFIGSPFGYILTKLPAGTTKIEFYFYDEYGPNPPLYAYMLFWLLEATNGVPFAGFTMNDGGWGTTPPRTMNHYYAYGDEEYSTRTMGPLRTIGWHKFAFVVGSGFVAMSVDDTPIFETNTTRVARYLQFQSSLAGGWGRVDDLVLTGATLVPPTLTISRSGDGIRLAWPISATASALQETTSPLAGWVDSPAPVVIQGNENVALVMTTGTPRFYRVRQ